jgi:hypothetical protein
MVQTPSPQWFTSHTGRRFPFRLASPTVRPHGVSTVRRRRIVDVSAPRADAGRPEIGQTAVHFAFTPFSAAIEPISHRVFHTFCRFGTCPSLARDLKCLNDLWALTPPLQATMFVRFPQVGVRDRFESCAQWGLGSEPSADGLRFVPGRMAVAGRSPTKRTESFGLLLEKCFPKRTELFGPFPEGCFRPRGWWSKLSVLGDLAGLATRLAGNLPVHNGAHPGGHYGHSCLMYTSAIPPAPPGTYAF